MGWLGWDTAAAGIVVAASIAEGTVVAASIVEDIAVEGSVAGERTAAARSTHLAPCFATAETPVGFLDC